VPRFSAALFDLDGTLVDSSHELVASVRDALLAVDPREPPDDDTILLEVGKPLETILRELGYPADENTAGRFVDTYRRVFAARLESAPPRLYPHVPETLGLLREAGVRLAVVTTKHQVQAELTVRAAGLAHRFDYVHGWAEGRRHKPDPEPVLVALRALGAQKDDAIMVGDTEQDILAAHAAGVTSCAVTYGFRPVLLLRTLRPDFIVSRFDDIGPIVG